MSEPKRVGAKRAGRRDPSRSDSGPEIDRHADISAAGSLARPHAVAVPGQRRSLRLATEIAVLYLAMPIITLHLVLGYRLPLFTVLPGLVIVFAGILVLDRSFSFRRELSSGFRPRHLIWILATFLVLGGIVAFVVSELMPSQFLAMPRERTAIWQRVVTFYPLLSVIPQEIAYRTFFFHRYGPLFRHHRWALIGINGLLFGFGHVLFGNWLAVAGTALTGMIFAYRYERTRSLWAVFIEHTLWGWLVFTVGLGGYFFTGIAFQGDFRLPWISK